MRGASKKTYKMLLEITAKYVLKRECRCGQTNCATVYLQREKKMKEAFVDIFSLGEGLTVLQFEEDGSIVLESIESTQYPYAEEVKTFFKTMLIDDSNKEDAEEIVNEFFKSCEMDTLECVVID